MPPRKSPKSKSCGTVVVNGRKRNLYKGDQGGVYHKDSAGKRTYIDKTVPRAKKCGPGAKRRTSPRRTSPRRTSPRRTSPRRKSHRGHLHVTKTSLKKKGNPVLHKHPKSKSPKRKSPKRKSPKRKSPKRKSPKRKSPKRKSPKKCSHSTRPSAYKCKTRGKLKQPYRDHSTNRCHYCYAEKK